MTLSRRRLRLAAGAGLASIAVSAVWWALGDGAAAPTVQPAQREATDDVEMAPAAASPRLAEAPVRRESVATSQARTELVAACTGQRFEVTQHGRAKTQCVESVQAVQNGSMRSYRAEAEGAAGRWLAIDTAGGQVLAVSLGRGGSAEFACEADACAGVVLGPADLRGVRGIALDDLQLARAAGSGSPGDVLRLSGHLESRPDDAVQMAPACAEQQVLISTATAGTSRFCAEDGVAVERNDGDARTYRFNGVDGIGIEVAIDGEGQLLRIGSGPAACAALSCAGVSISSPGPDGERTLVFNGTLLQADVAPGAWAGLSGRLVLPPS